MSRNVKKKLAVALAVILAGSILPGGYIYAEENGLTMEDSQFVSEETDKEYLEENSGEETAPQEEAGVSKEEQGVLKEAQKNIDSQTYDDGQVSEQKAETVARAGTVYTVKNATQYTNAIKEIEKSDEPKAVIVLSSDFSGQAPTVVGAAGKHITLQSEGDAARKVRLYDGRSLVGDVTFDNVTITFGGTTMPEFYAAGHLFETTLRTVTDFDYASTALILYGGADGSDVSGDTNIIVRSGMFKEIYGGGYNGDVAGDANITIGSETGEPSKALKIQSVYGGGYARSAGSTAAVSGNTNVTVLSGSVQNYLYGGGRTSGKCISDEERAVAEVAGTSNVTVGYPGITEGKISIQRVYAGSYNSVVNAVQLHTYTSGVFYGGGGCDTVKTSINIIAEGAGEKGADVYGGGQSSYPLTSASGPVRIGTAGNADPAVNIRYSYKTSNTKTTSSVYTGGGAQTEITGNVKTEIPEGAEVNLGMLSLGTTGNTDTLSISGRSELDINGVVNAAFVQGNRAQVDADKESAQSEVIVKNGAVLKTGVFQDWGTVILDNKAQVLVDSIYFPSSFPGSSEEDGNVPFDRVYNLTLNDGAQLDTRNVASSLQGNVDLGDALWIMRGRITVQGNLAVRNADIQIPAVIPGQNYGEGRNNKIALTVNGAAGGTCQVTLMDKDTWTEAVPVTGDNYILVNKAQAPSKETFMLANADSGEKYLARLDDAQGLNYYMWQVYEDPDEIVLVPEDQTIYSGGESGSDANAEFPHPIYLTVAEDGTKTELGEDVQFKVDGKPWDGQKEGSEYPFIVKYYEKNPDGSVGNEITNDEHYGDFIARIVPADGIDSGAKITTAEGNPLRFVEGTLRIRYVSSFTEASGNELTTEVVEYASGDAAAREEARQTAEKLAVSEGSATVIMPDDTDILLNGNENYVYPDNADSKISLLYDELLPETPGGDNSSFEKMLSDKAETENYEMDGYRSMYRYLDLVDTNDSNAWVASTKGTDVFWPYPDGANKNTDIRLLHFTGLHREYRMEGEETLPEQIETSVIEEVQFEKTEEGVWFHIPQSGFSPFVLSWENTGEENPNPNEPGKDKPDSGQGTSDAGQTDRKKELESVQTGDNGIVYVWLAAVILSAGTLIGIVNYRRLNHHSRRR